MGMAGNNILYKVDNGERVIPRENDVEVGDYIFINSDGKAEKALANSINKMPCIGRVVRIQSNKCVFKKDLIENDYGQITPRDVFFISDTEAGEITDTVPTSSDSVIQMIGLGLANDEILVNIDPTNVIIRS